MPHQDKDDLRTLLCELKEIFSPIMDANFQEVKRHGNATIAGQTIAVLALLTFGWGRLKRTQNENRTENRTCHPTLIMILAKVVYCDGQQSFVDGSDDWFTGFLLAFLAWVILTVL